MNMAGKQCTVGLCVRSVLPLSLSYGMVLYNKSQHYNIHFLLSYSVGQILQPLVTVKSVCPPKEVSNQFITYYW